MINRKLLASATLVALATVFAPLSRAQAPLQDDFTGTATQNQWFFFNGACLTAGTSSVAGNLGQSAGTDTSGNQLYSLPGCINIASSYYNEVLVGGEKGYLGSASKPSTPGGGVPDDAGQGALRFTNGSPGGYAQNGAIVSASTFPTGQGVEVTFETVTYRGDSGGAGKDGADGLSFYMLDGCMPMAGATPDSHCFEAAPNTTTYANPVYGVQGNTFPGIGAWGGSLAYTCSNANTPYDGLVGAYLGLGIDEFGNFLNGTTNTLGETGTSATGDNTASGGGYQPGRIGLRGAGNISWQALNTAYGTDPGSNSKPYYPSSLSASQKLAAVQKTCSSGHLWNYKNVLTGGSAKDAGLASLSNAVNTAGILDYPALGTTTNPGYTVLTGLKIANESATKRADGNPILYDLKITQDGLLSLSYQQCTSTGCGAKQSVLTKQQITTSNGPLPSSVRFGFAGSTGGDTNVHEVMCFKAQPASESAGSAGVNQKQSAKISGIEFAYFSYYDPDDWTGRVTANLLGTDSSGALVVQSVPTWDASCVLSGIAAGQSCSTGVLGPVAAESPSNRVILSWDGTKGVPFESSSLSAAETAALNGDSQAANRISYLRGDRTNEINSSGVGLFRARDSVLADIVDSSPTWVGPPSSPYTAGWQDRLNVGASQPENSGTQTYTQFISAEQTRPNVVYVGANDGMLHGFRSGGFDSSGNFTTATTPNDGEEVLAFMPGSIIQGSTLSGSSNVDTIHGTDPTNSNAVTTNLDYSGSQYGHNFYVDATPGTGDLFYDGTWHTWLVSGLGPGGAALFALDITNPTAANFAEGNAQNVVIGEWTPSSLSCASPSNCGANLGNTYGTPVIRRLHNGSWGVIFGNGIGSKSGDAGIYVMVVSGSGTGVSTTFYYLSTGVAGGNGIAYVTPADLDGDHITDYVYAGDVKGNVWRFDLTSSDPANWGISRCLDYPTCSTVTTAPLFSTGGQPITSQLVVASGPSISGAPQIMVAFGTGQKALFTNTNPTTYVSGTQDLYGFWDWNMAPWNAKGSAQYSSLVLSQLPSTLSSPYAITKSNLQAQTFTINSIGNRDIVANQTVCWQGTSACSTGANNQFGWYVDLPGASEQIVFNPELLGSAFLVNSTVPPDNEVLSCKTTTETGYTYALNIMSGGAFTKFFPILPNQTTPDPNAAGVSTNATGTSFPVRTGNGNYYLVYQTYSPGTAGTTPLPPPLPIDPPANAVGHRLTWVQLR